MKNTPEKHLDFSKLFVNQRFTNYVIISFLTPPSITTPEKPTPLPNKTKQISFFIPRPRQKTKSIYTKPEKNRSEGRKWSFLVDFWKELEDFGRIYKLIARSQER
jgi:hypothetical protein